MLIVADGTYSKIIRCRQKNLLWRELRSTYLDTMAAARHRYTRMLDAAATDTDLPFARIPPSSDPAAGQPARLLRRRRPRHPDRRARRSTVRRRRSMSATRSSTTATWSKSLKAKGAVFVEELDEVPGRRAGGLLRPRRAEVGAGRGAAAASCSISTPPARWSARCTARPSATAAAAARSLLIGHAGHPEVVGTMGQLPAGAVTLVETRGRGRRRRSVPTRRTLAYVTQTTLSVDDTAEIVAALRARFPAIHGPRARRTSATPPPTARRR